MTFMQWQCEIQEEKTLKMNDKFQNSMFLNMSLQIQEDNFYMCFLNVNGLPFVQ